MNKYAVLIAFLSAALLHTSAVAAPPAPDCRTRPAWCVDGYTCEPTSCTARATVALEAMGAQLVAARAERPRWFRPFLEGGLTWSPATQMSGAWGAAGVQLWRLEAAVELTQDDVQLKAGFRREW